MTRISFFQASRRLHSDATHLISDTNTNRSLNAGHFWGLSAECGLKYLLLLCGGLQRNSVTGDLVGQRPHANQLVDASGLAAHFRQLVGGNTHSRYVLQASGIDKLQSWKAEYRYYDPTHPDYPSISEQEWQTASLQIQLALDNAMLDGHPIY